MMADAFMPTSIGAGTCRPPWILSAISSYVNRCPRIGISLDWVDNQFFSIDGRYLMCANHGATFEPATGECIWGPCVGAALQNVPLEMEGEKIFVQYPHRDDQD